MYLDLRDLAQEWRELLDEAEEARQQSGEDDPDVCVSLGKYQELCSALSIDLTPDALESYGDNFDPMLIAEDDFENYAQELAEETGTVSNFTSWPFTCIDWGVAADELKQDYTAVEYDGETHYTRA